MVLEMAGLRVRPDQTAPFEQAFAQARTTIAAMPGHLGHALQRCTLLVRWQTLEAHTVGFRQDPQYPHNGSHG